MKKIYLIRHAKSSWSDFSLADFDRPLNKRGKKNAPFMGKILKKKNVSPDIILSSSAKRAKKTIKAISKELGCKDKIIFDKNLYACSTQYILNTVVELDNKIETIFIVGHNPELNMFVERFVDFNQNIPTCGIVELEFNCQKWKDINTLNVNLKSFIYPKQFQIL